MLNTIRAYGLIILFFILLAAGVFRCAWPENKVFSGSDANIGILAVNHRQLPQKFSGGYGPSPLFGNAGINPVTFSNIGKAFINPELFSNTWYSLYLIISSISFVAYLRLWKIRWLAIVFGALSAYWVGAITICSSGHLYKLGVMAFFSISLYLLEISMRMEVWWKSLGLAILTGIGIGLMLLEQQDVGLLAGLFLAVYALVRMMQLHGSNWRRWLLIFIPIALLGGGLSVGTALRAYKQNVTTVALNSDPAKKWDFITQWSMVPSEWPDLIAPGYSGWSTGNPDGPYWGKCGQSAEWTATKQGFRNFRLDSLYIGVIPILLALYGFGMAFRDRKHSDGSDRVFVLWGILGCIALLLAFGKFSPLYKLFYQLPLVGNIRAPIKFLHNFQIIIGILSAYGVNQYFSRESDSTGKKVPGLAIASGATAVLFFILSVSARMDSSIANYSDWGEYAAVISKNISKAWIHSAILATILSVCTVLLWKRVSVPKWGLLALLIGTVVFDSIFLTSHYFKAIDIAGLKKGNVVIDYLKQNQGDERIFFTDQNNVYNSWLAMEVPFHGLQTFNFWQMPRMSAEYKEYLGIVGRNQMRLWQLASVKYITAPVSILQQFSANERLKEMFEPVMFYRFRMQSNALVVVQIQTPEQTHDQVLLRFKAHIPRFALYHDWKKIPLEQHCAALVTDTFNPRTTVLVDDDLESQPTGTAFETVEAKTTIKDAVVKTSSSENGVLMFTQRFQNGWSVAIDGSPAKLFRCNYLCMGVLVPSGQHEVRFKYK